MDPTGKAVKMLYLLKDKHTQFYSLCFDSVQLPLSEAWPFKKVNSTVSFSFFLKFYFSQACTTTLTQSQHPHDLKPEFPIQSDSK